MKIVILIVIFITTIFAKEITVGAGLSLEPYIIQKNNSGMELDIVKTVLEDAGYSIMVNYIPFIRIPLYLEKRKVDAAITINKDSNIKNIYYSNSHITYQNVAVSLKSKKIQLKNIQQLENLKVVSFQNASKYLGFTYNTIIPKMKFYQELSNQMLQIKLLFAQRVDVIILDINIFKYLKEQIKDKSIDTKQDVNIYPIFPKSHYSVGFIDKTIRDKFNISLKKIKDNGTYNKIIKQYIKKGYKL